MTLNMSMEETLFAPAYRMPFTSKKLLQWKTHAHAYRAREREIGQFRKCYFKSRNNTTSGFPIKSQVLMPEWPHHTENQTNIIQSNISVTNYPQLLGSKRKQNIFPERWSWFTLHLPPVSPEKSSSTNQKVGRPKERWWRQRRPTWRRPGCLWIAASIWGEEIWRGPLVLPFYGSLSLSIKSKKY